VIFFNHQIFFKNILRFFFDHLVALLTLAKTLRTFVETLVVSLSKRAANLIAFFDFAKYFFKYFYSFFSSFFDPLLIVIAFFY